MNERLVHFLMHYSQKLHPKLVPREKFQELRFCCLEDCAECCKGGHLLIIPERDLQERLVDFLYSLPIPTAKDLKVMRRNSDGSCILLQNNKCLVQDIKPLACRSYPIFVDPHTAKVYLDVKCPGIGKGEQLSTEKEREAIQFREMYWQLMELSEEERRAISKLFFVSNIVSYNTS